MYMQPGQFGVQLGTDMGGGATQGIADMNQLDAYRGNLNMQNLLNQLVLASNQAQFGTYQQDAPVREAERGEKIATAKTRTMTEPMRQTAEAQKAQQGVAFTTETQPGAIAATKATNLGKVDQEAFQRDERNLERFQTVLPMLAKSPSAMADWVKFAEQSGWDKDHPYRKYMQGSDPSNFGERLTEIQSHAVANMTQRRALQQGQQKGDIALVQEGMQQGGANYRAELAADWHRDVAKSRAEAKSQADKLEQDLVKVKNAYLAAMRKKPADPNEVQALRAEYDLTFQQYVAAKGAAAPQYYQIPGSGLEMGRPPVQTPQPPGAAPAAPAAQPPAGGPPPGAVRKKN